MHLGLPLVHLEWLFGQRRERERERERERDRERERERETEKESHSALITQPYKGPGLCAHPASLLATEA